MLHPEESANIVSQRRPQKQADCRNWLSIVQLSATGKNNYRKQERTNQTNIVPQPEMLSQVNCIFKKSLPEVGADSLGQNRTIDFYVQRAA